MKDKQLSGRKVAILATDGFEESELFEPLKALQEAGAQVQIISLKEGSIKGWNHSDWGRQINVDETVSRARAQDFDALMLPGGVMNPDKLRMDPAAVDFVKNFVQSQKPIAAICHGPWTLIEADAVAGKKMTSWPSLKSDLIHAGAQWTNAEVVVDQGLVTSRKPADIPAFCDRMIEEFSHNSQSKTSLQSQEQISLH